MINSESFAGCFNSKLAGKDDKDQEIGMTQRGEGITIIEYRLFRARKIGTRLL